MSVALGVLLIATELDPEIVLEGYPDFGLLSLSAGYLRSLHLGVVAEPTEQSVEESLIPHSSMGSRRASDSDVGPGPWDGDRRTHTQDRTPG